MTSYVTLSRILSHSVTWVSHAINRKRYLKEKKNGKELSTREAVYDTIEELYNIDLEEEETLRIVEVIEKDLDFDLDIKNSLADLYLMGY